MAVVGGSAARSMSTCLVPGGTLLTHRSSLRSMFKTGTDRLKGRNKGGFRAAAAWESCGGP